jgi:non-lysosomal glucosylceramidase
VWTGIEYHVAAHLIYEGWPEEGLSIVKGVRDRHDGVRRNPWNEFECGHHYARAMSSWSVLLALSGYEYDGVKKHLGFAPKISPGRFHSFFSTGSAWGTFSQRRVGTKHIAELEVAWGEQTLKSFSLAYYGKPPRRRLQTAGWL